MDDEAIYNREAYLLGRCEAFLFVVNAKCNAKLYREILKAVGFTDEEIKKNILAKEEGEND